ncbi:MAG: hypothetical protein COB39_01320 [Marinosulfonomonas sp.]|nr:MAG: hypothetical protein COB39_01320 [Marinosulfonomonas sp.]
MYKPERFSSTYEQENGEAIWAFLNEDTNIIRMKTASYLSRPAIEALSPYIYEAFGDSVTVDRIKQMMGHMVRQIMERHGYRLQQGNVKITAKGSIFSRASRYVHAEGGV